MEEEEHYERESRPEPAKLDKEDIEDVAFLCKVGGGDGGGMRLRYCAVGGGAGVGFEKGEEGAKQECGRIDAEKESFE